MKLENAIVVRFGRFCEVLYKNGVEYMKKLINILVLILIICTLLLSVVACEKEEETPAVEQPETPTTVKYDMEYMYACPMLKEVEQTDENKMRRVFTFMISYKIMNVVGPATNYYRKEAELNSFSILDNDVTVTYVNGYDQNSREEKALITSKWLYYASLLVSSDVMQQGSFSTKPYIRARYETTVQELVNVINVNKGYETLEEVALMAYYHPKFDEYIEIYEDPTGSESNFAVLHSYFKEMYYQYEMLPVVLTKYNLWDASKEVGKVGSVLIKDGLDTDENGGWSEYKVVGYYETEADKLLSTGVAMEGEEYELVMEQLNNPTYYAMYNLAEAVK